MTSWLVTYLVHSTLFVALAWVASRLASDRPLVREDRKPGLADA